MSPAWLLAQRENWERLGDRFSGDAAEVNYQELGMLLAVAVGGALVIWLLRSVARWQEGRSRHPNPRRLFRDLSRVHRLNRWERRVLRALADAVGLRQPAEVFVRPDAFRVNPLPAEAADDAPRAWMIAAPRFCTVVMNSPCSHSWSARTTRSPRRVRPRRAARAQAGLCRGSSPRWSSVSRAKRSSSRSG